MNAPILFAHEQAVIGRAVARVLTLRGYEVTLVTDGDQALAALQRRRFAALVVEVALPEIPGYELIGPAKSLAQSDPKRGAAAVVLVASVYRRTRYKRRPQRLYGADDYVEVHHLGDMLPDKLDRLLGRGFDPTAAEPLDEAELAIAAVLRDSGDGRLGCHDPRALAELLAADVVLYGGDAILDAGDPTEARRALDADLRAAQEIFEQATRADPPPEDDLVERAFEALVRALGRTGMG